MNQRLPSLDVDSIHIGTFALPGFFKVKLSSVKA